MANANLVVSIITPSFNRATIINETANSIFSQTYPNWEWVIVDDGSTDNSWTVLQDFAKKDNRVKVFKRDREPKGAATCRNIAVEKCTGDYLLFLDTDDLLASFCLEQRIEATRQNPDGDFIIFPMLMFSRKPDDTGLLWNVETGENDLARILRSDPICQGTGTIWKKAAFLNIGMWREDLKIWQDIELHIRSMVNDLKYHKRMDLPPDVFLRVSEVSLSRTGYHSLEKLKSRIAVFKYAFPEIIKRGPIEPELDGLKSMGVSLIMNALKGGYFSEASELIGLCREYELINAEQLRLFSTYKLIKKIRADKLPFVEKVCSNKLKKAIPSFPQTIGKVKYYNTIKI